MDSSKPNGEANDSTSPPTKIVPKSKLNPNAAEWRLADNRVSEKERCLYITFSIWNPSSISADEIAKYFNKYDFFYFFSIYNNSIYLASLNFTTTFYQLGTLNSTPCKVTS